MRRANTNLPEWDRWIVVALGGSLAVHLLAFGVLELGRRFDLFSPDRLPAWLKPLTKPLPSVKVPTMTVNPQQSQPLIFVQVDPSRAAEPPPDTRFYSSADSQAANDKVKIESEKPNIEGKQKDIVKTETTPREKAFPLQPAAPPPEPKTMARPQPKAAPKPGDLALAKPADSPKVGEDLNKRLGEPDEPPRQRPRTVEEAKRMLNPTLSGEALKQEGGVKRRAQIALDVKGTPFGRYDEAFIRAVQNRWYDLIDERRPSGSGRVLVVFRLNQDGRVTHARIEETEVDLIMTHLCQKAIEDPSPYEAWPSDMRRMVGATYRELKFSFIYY
jgi:hypothetical protein